MTDPVCTCPHSSRNLGVDITCPVHGTPGNPHQMAVAGLEGRVAELEKQMHALMTWCERLATMVLDR